MFWIPAHVQHFVKIHDKLLNLAGMTSCGTACEALRYIPVNVKLFITIPALTIRNQDIGAMSKNRK
jgi:hypothetical protein